MKSAVIIFSDLHINSKLGLCHPDAKLDIGKYKLSRGQEWLWENWMDVVETIKIIPNDYEKIIVFNGDLIDMDTKKRSDQMISQNSADVIRICIETIRPVLEYANKIYVIRGTGAHTGESGWCEETIAMCVEAQKDSSDNYSHWHIRATTSDVKFDIAHHTTAGQLPWTEKNAANKLVTITMWRYLVDMKQDSPDVVVRSHMHMYSDTGNNHKTFGVITPSFQLSTEYAYRKGYENKISDIGFVTFLCEDGKFDYKPKLYKLEAYDNVWEKNF